MGLACEAAEIMEHFLWLDCEPSRQQMKDPAKLAAVAEEVADVIVFAASALAMDGCPDPEPTGAGGQAFVTEHGPCGPTTGLCAQPFECLPVKGDKAVCQCQLFPDPLTATSEEKKP